MEDVRYPIGKFQAPEDVTDAHRQAWIDDLASMPGELCSAVQNLTDEQLDTPYRSGGWTVRQVVHHLADAQGNACVRIKLALTEDDPNTMTYEQNLWAELPDSRDMPIHASLAILDGVHQRVAYLIRNTDSADFARKFQNPRLGEMNLDTAVARFAWHARHHLGHIVALIQRMGW